MFADTTQRQVLDDEDKDLLVQTDQAKNDKAKNKVQQQKMQDEIKKNELIDLDEMLGGGFTQ